MPKHLRKILLVVLMIAPGLVKAQYFLPLPTYPSYESATRYLYELNYTNTHKITFKGSVIIKIDSASQLKKVIAANAQNKVVGVEVLIESRPDLQKIFTLLTHFPYLRELRLSDRYVALYADKPYQLPANIHSLTQLTTVWLNCTKNLNMEDALEKIRPMQHIHTLRISGYDHQISPAIFKLKQVKNIGLSAENIGNNNLSQAKWESLILDGDSYKMGQSGHTIKNIHDAKAVAALSHIKTLKRLEFNLWASMDSIDISKLSQITELNFHVSKWSVKIFEQIGHLTRLKKLSIDYIDWSQKSISALKDLTNLTDLRLNFRAEDKDSPLEGISIMSQFKNLETLDINSAVLELPDDLFNKMPKLKRISLRSNRLTKIPSGLFNLPELEYLNLESNKIRELPDLPKYGCLNLKNLWVDNNQLTYFPPAISGLSKLEILSVADNGITTAAGDYRNLKNLQKIDLSHNILDQFPKGLSSNQRVECIAIKGNNIKTLPEPDEGNYQLKSLFLDENTLASLPAHIDRYKKLEELSLSGARLPEIPEALGNCDSLTSINLYGSIAAKTYLPASLQKLKKLRSLNLSKDSLIDHQSIWDFVLACRNPGLQIALLSDNITTLPATPKWADVDIDNINLSQNHLTTLPKEFAGIHAVVFLAQNNFKADTHYFNRPAVSQADLKVWFEQLHVPLNNYSVSNKDYAKSLFESILYLYDAHEWVKIAELADKAKAADPDFYQKNVPYQVGISRFNLKDYKQTIKDLSRPSVYDVITNKYKAKAFLALGKPDSAAITYASVRLLSNYIKADSICQISGNKTLLQQLKDSLEDKYQRTIAFSKDHEYYNDDEMVFAPKDSYHYYFLNEYATFRLLEHRPVDALDILNKKVILGYDPAAKTLLAAAANYLIDPKTFDESEKALTALAAKGKRITYFGFVPITDWLNYSDYTKDQKEHLIALQKIVYP